MTKRAYFRPHRPRAVTPTARPTAHKYPVRDRSAVNYLIARAPRAIITAARERARAEGLSLRVVVIDLLKAYGDRRVNAEDEWVWPLDDGIF